MRRVRGALFALGCAGALALSACGNGVPTSSGTGGGSSVGVAKANIGTADVKIDATDSLQFAPTSGDAKVNQIVQWSNTGSVLHNVTFDDSALTDNALSPGGTWQIKFTKAGSYSYKCTIHPGMDGTIKIS